MKKIVRFLCFMFFSFAASDALANICFLPDGTTGCDTSVRVDCPGGVVVENNPLSNCEACDLAHEDDDGTKYYCCYHCKCAGNDCPESESCPEGTYTSCPNYLGVGVNKVLVKTLSDGTECYSCGTSDTCLKGKKASELTCSNKEKVGETPSGIPCYECACPSGYYKSCPPTETSDLTITGLSISYESMVCYQCLAPTNCNAENYPYTTFNCHTECAILGDECIDNSSVFSIKRYKTCEFNSASGYKSDTESSIDSNCHNYEYCTPYDGAATYHKIKDDNTSGQHACATEKAAGWLTDGKQEEWISKGWNVSICTNTCEPNVYYNKTCSSEVCNNGECKTCETGTLNKETCECETPSDDCPEGQHKQGEVICGSNEDEAAGDKTEAGTQCYICQANSSCNYPYLKAPSNIFYDTGGGYYEILGHVQGADQSVRDALYAGQYTTVDSTYEHFFNRIKKNSELCYDGHKFRYKTICEGTPKSECTGTGTSFISNNCNSDEYSSYNYNGTLQFTVKGDEWGTCEVNCTERGSYDSIEDCKSVYSGTSCSRDSKGCYSPNIASIDTEGRLKYHCQGNWGSGYPEGITWSVSLVKDLTSYNQVYTADGKNTVLGRNGSSNKVEFKPGTYYLCIYKKESNCTDLTILSPITIGGRSIPIVEGAGADNTWQSVHCGSCYMEPINFSNNTHISVAGADWDCEGSPDKGGKWTTPF